MKRLSKITLAIAFALTSAAAFAQASGQATQSSQAPSTASMSEGEVKKINKDAGKVTIKHGELKNLSMPAMTMIFRVKDPAMLDQIKVGDKINFVADQVGGQLTVTQLEVKK